CGPKRFSIRRSSAGRRSRDSRAHEDSSERRSRRGAEPGPSASTCRETVMPTSTGTLTDGTTVTVDSSGAPDPSLPVLILLHGMGGSSLDMTAPERAWRGLSFNRSVFFPLYKDEGVHFGPPVLPAARFYLDPPAPTPTSWNAALKAAGFTTITYDQTGPL